MHLPLLMLLLAAALGTPTEWGVVVDCGSSGSRVHIYFWDSAPHVSELQPDSEADKAKLRTTPGISAFVDDPEAVGPYFANLLQEAARWVPADQHARTPVRAYATAGMRLHTAAEQEGVWDTIRATIRNSAFKSPYSTARTITGNYEGLCHWIAMQQILTKSPAAGGPAFGTMDLGGASTQIVFPAEVILQDGYEVLLNGTVLRLYAHSYMRYGKDQAHARVRQLLAGRGPRDGDLAEPCLNAGLNATHTVACAPAQRCERRFVGTGNWSACRALTAELMQQDYECLFPEEACAVRGTYQPLHKGLPFWATSAYFFTVYGLGLCGWDDAWQGTWRDIEAAGRRFCATPWANLSDRDEFAAGYCFASAYVPALLQALDIPPDSTQVSCVRGGGLVTWALGAQIDAIMDAAAHAALQPYPSEPEPLGGTKVDIFSLVAGLPSAAVIGGAICAILTYLYCRRPASPRGAELALSNIQRAL